jgi:ribosome-binding protein aMBF1 (putative translation factor)
MAKSKTTTSPFGPPIWVTTKDLVVGDQIANGRRQVEPLPTSFATVTSIVMKGPGHKVITLEGGGVFSLGGVATKVWVRKPLTVVVYNPATLTAEREAVKNALAAKPAPKAPKAGKAAKATLTAEREAVRDLEAIKAAARTYVGAQVKAARLEAGLSKRELAERMATSEGAIDRLEGGRTNPTSETLANVAQGLGVDRLVIVFGGAR